MGTPYLFYDGARVSPESPLGKELLKWERPFDYRPENNPYPKMMFRAQHRPDGRRSVGEVDDSLFAQHDAMGHRIVTPGAAEQWTRRCQLTVKDDQEKQKAYEQGWRDTPQQALDYLEHRDTIVSTATAERHAADARMGEQARREAATVDESTLQHVPEITSEVRERATARKRKPKGSVSNA